MPKFFQTQREITAAIIGALLAAVFSLLVGLYTLDRSFKTNFSLGQISGLRKDIEFLARVENEIDVNTRQLTESRYNLAFKASEPSSRLAAFRAKAATMAKGKGKEAKDAREFNQVMESFSQFDQPSQTILELQKPIQPFVVDSWGAKFPDIGDIDFQLLSDVNEYYRHARKLNWYINYYRTLDVNAKISASQFDAFAKEVSMYNASLESFIKLDHIKLKNRVSQEIQRLTKIKDKISASVGVE